MHRFVALLCLLAFVLSARPARAEVQRVLLPPAPRRVLDKEMREPLEKARLVALLYLAEWLEQDPGIVLVDAAQAEAILGYSTGPAWVRGEGEVYAAVTAILPLDAVITTAEVDGKLAVTIHQQSRTESVALAYTGGASTAAFLTELTGFTVANLGLDPEQAPTRRYLPMDKPGLVEDSYLSRVLWADWMANSGEARMNLLQSHQGLLTTSTFTAAQVLDAAAWLTRDPRKIQESGKWSQVAKQALFRVLGSDQESQGIAFCRVNKLDRKMMEEALITVVAGLGKDAMDAALEGGEDDGMLPTDGAALEGVAALLQGSKSPAEQASAIRFLGAMKSVAALSHLQRIAAAGSVEHRRAVAWALGEYGGDTGLDVLRRQVAEAETAFIAAHSLWQRGEAPPKTLALARAELTKNPASAPALAILSALGTTDDTAALRAGLTVAGGQHRAVAMAGLLQLAAATPDDIDRWLMDPAEPVVVTVLSGLSGEAVGRHRAALVRLANHPDDALAEAARLRLSSAMPAEAAARQLFELQVEHPYVRRQLVEAWAADGGPAAIEGLVAATTNTEPHIRALAILHLASVAPERAQACLPAGLADPHRVVRLYTAAAAARCSSSAVISMLQRALSAPGDPATRLYLSDAINRTLPKIVDPPLPPTVNRVSAEKNQSFNCGWTAEVERSPFDGFYGLHPPDETDIEAVRRAHAAGKIFLLRANQTAKNPAQVLLNSGWRDGFWLGLDSEFGGIWDTMDGVVLGEESMYFRPWDQWEAGWRLFCREAGIDPLQVQGDRQALSPAQREAWLDWEERVAVEGFNVMVDYIKLRYGKLRPGFQVATFMPDQNGPGPYDHLWKFDIAAGYYYAAPTQLRYAAIRRMKTLWPDRPVLWLNQGKAGVGLGLNLTQIQHSTKVPNTPLHRLTDITSADTIATWLAGGHAGSFSIYLFVHVGWKGEDFGRWVQLADLTATSSVFAEAIEHSFRGLADVYRTAADIKSAGQGVDGEIVADDEALGLTLEEPDDGPDQFDKRAAAEREAFRRGFLLEGKLILDPMIMLSGVAFPAQSHRVLLVGPRGMNAPGFNLANDFDCFLQVNKIATHNLQGYKMIGIAANDDMPLQDETIGALSDWLRDEPGLLYVHGWLPTDNSRIRRTVATIDASLTTDWPWEGALTAVLGTQKQRKREVVVTESYTLTGEGARVLQEKDGKAVLVFWRGAGMKGGVLFNAGVTDPAVLQTAMNDLARDESVGMAFAGPIGMVGVTTPEVTAMAADSSAVAAHQLAGVDVLTGIVSPTLQPGRAGAVVATRLRGDHMIANDGVSAFCTTGVDAAGAVAGGVTITASGLIQAVTAAGALQVKTTGAALPVIAPDDLLEWMYSSSAPGIATLSRPDEAGSISLIRSPLPLTITAQ